MMVGYGSQWMMTAGNNHVPSQTQSSIWTRYEDKRFEHALVFYPEGVAYRWHKIATELPGKSPEEVKAHYEALLHDVHQIDSGRVELPTYSDDFPWENKSEPSQISFGSTGRPNHEVERKKGSPWSEEEHRLFLVGLERYGKGDWRSISRNVVVSRTPTQVASHAQKYYLRQNSAGKKERKRSSIHDITTAEETKPVPPPSHFPPDQGQGTSQGYDNLGFPM